MLKSGKELEGAPRLFVTLATSAIPIVIVGGLLYAAFFVKAQAVVSNVQPPAIERRDTFLGIAVPNDKVIWAVGGNGKIVRSEDTGSSWSAQATSVPFNLQSIAAWSPEKAVAVGNGGVVLRTIDSGKTWQEVSVPKSEVANKLLRVRAYENGMGWAVGELGAVLKTADFGQTWTRAVAEKDQGWNDIFFLGNEGWLVGEFGQMMKTSDGGATWSPLTSGVPSSLMSVFFRDPQNGVAAGLSGAVLITRDGGAHWTQPPRQTREHLNHVIWDGARWVAVGDKGVMVTGTDGEQTWKSERISEGDLSWHTQVEHLKSADNNRVRYLLAGASLALLDGKSLKTFGRNTD